MKKLLTMQLAVLVVSCIFPGSLSSAKAEGDRIPPLAFLSERLFSEDRMRLAQQRQALLNQLAEFQAAARAFNAKAAEAQTDEEFNVLQGSRGSYIQATDSFNREVAAAEAAAARRAELPVARVAASSGEYYFVTKDGHKLEGTEAVALALDGGTRVVTGRPSASRTGRPAPS